MKRLALDRASIAIVLAALSICYLHLYHSTVDDFALDISGHRAHVEFISKHHRLPTADDGVLTAHHLPTYYVLATALHDLGKTLGVEPFQTARQTSVLFYAAYLVVAALLLNALFASRQVYYLMLSMVAFWPIGVAMATRLHPDVFACMGQMGIIYSLLLWVRDKERHALANAFFFAGLLLLVRDYGVFYLIVCAAVLVHALYKKHQRLNVRLGLSIAFSLACYGLSSLHRVMMPQEDFGDAWRNMPTNFNEVFFYFNPWIFVTETMLSPDEGKNIVYFWHFYFRSALLGHFTDWTAWAAVFALGVVWLAILAYTVCGLVRSWRRIPQKERRALGVLFFFIAMMTGLLLAARYTHIRIPPIGDVRYVFPITALYAACFGKVIEWNQGAYARVGNGLALGFILLSISLWAIQIFGS